MPIFVRHARAVRERPSLPDEHRYLDELGRQQARTLGMRLLSAPIELRRVVCSPLVRAVQTAELLARAHDVDVTIDPALAPDPDLDELLARYGDEADVALVGHEPYLGWLVGRATATGPRPFDTAEARVVVGGALLLVVSGRE